MGWFVSRCSEQDTATTDKAGQTLAVETSTPCEDKAVTHGYPYCDHHTGVLYPLLQRVTCGADRLHTQTQSVTHLSTDTVVYHSRTG